MKLTDAEIRAMKRFASSMADHIPPCPWNPFPRNSEWGRKIDKIVQEIKAEIAEKRRQFKALATRPEEDSE